MKPYLYLNLVSESHNTETDTNVNWNSNDTIIFRDENEEPKGFKKTFSNPDS